MNRQVRNIMRMTALCFALLFVACRPVEPIPSNEVSIAHIRMLGEGAAQRITQAWYICGRVTSSDLDGNFYKKIVVEDATGAIELNVDGRELFLSAPWGGRVRIYVEGLWVGSYGHSRVLGAKSDGGFVVSDIALRDFERRVQIITPTDSTYRPTLRNIKELTFKDNQRWIRFDSVQFIAEECLLTWGCADSTIYRHLTTPAGDTLRVATSAYAAWADRRLPEGSGQIDGIVCYRRGRWELRPSSIVGIRMERPRFKVR